MIVNPISNRGGKRMRFYPIRAPLARYVAQAPQEMGYFAEAPEFAEAPQDMGYYAEAPEYVSEAPEQMGYFAESPEMTGYGETSPDMGYFAEGPPLEGYVRERDYNPRVAPVE